MAHHAYSSFDEYNTKLWCGMYCQRSNIIESMVIGTYMHLNNCPVLCAAFSYPLHNFVFLSHSSLIYTPPFPKYPRQLKYKVKNKEKTQQGTKTPDLSGIILLQSSITQSNMAG